MTGALSYLVSVSARAAGAAASSAHAVSAATRIALFMIGGHTIAGELLIVGILNGKY
jgi:hypothetical protein